MRNYKLSGDRSRRDHASTALVEGFFGTLWFSWQQVTPTTQLNNVLLLGSIIAILAAVIGGALSFRFKALAAIADSQSARHRYNIIAATEFGVAGLGALILGIAGQTSYIPVWVCLVVGVHFFSLAPVLRDRSLYLLGALFCTVAIIALCIGLTTHIDPSAVTGTGAGGLLTLFAVFNLVTLPGIKQPRSR